MACGERQLSSPMSSSPDPSSPQGNGAAASTGSFHAFASVTQTLWGMNSKGGASGENSGARPGIGKSWEAGSEEEMKTPVTPNSTSSPAARQSPTTGSLAALALGGCQAGGKARPPRSESSLPFPLHRSCSGSGSRYLTLRCLMWATNGSSVPQLTRPGPLLTYRPRGGEEERRGL